MGYAALDLALWPHLTAREHMALAAELRGVPFEAESLHAVGLEGAADKLVGQFSTGMRSRLKLALAVQDSPAILMLDEPSASLDEEGRDLVDRLVTLQRGHGAVVVATNDTSDRRHATHELELG
jgi:ABC-type multidrug transport system ATPase subunit